MTASLLKDGFPSAHRTTRQRIESSIDLRRLFSAIDSDPMLIGAGVVYIDDAFNVVVLREFQAICRVHPIKVVLREAPRYVGPVEFKRMLEHEPRESQWVAEALGTAVTCSGAVLSWMVVTSGVMLMPFTAGTSAVITFIGQAALAASITQCAIGLGRTTVEAFAPQYLDHLDNDAWYQAVDAASGRYCITGCPPLLLYFMALLSPLIGLLALNSTRSRERRHKMVEIRQKREAIIATLKKQGRWKWW